MGMKVRSIINKEVWWRCVDIADEKFVAIAPACTCHDNSPFHHDLCETTIVWSECLLAAAKEMEAENAAD